MQWTAALVQLQEVDRELAAARQRLAEVETALRDDSALAGPRARVARLAEAAKAARQKQERLEFDLDRVEEKRRQKEIKLYGGAVKNPRELADLQAKVASLKRRKAALEDELLEAMLAREEAEAELEAAQADLAEVEAAWEAEHRHLEEEAAELHARIPTLEAQSAALSAQLPADILASYRHLLRRKNGIAVARLRGDSCSVCGTMVPPRARQAAKAGQVAYCDSCGRLLVA
jgi:predicted  nucleic acid-binding Zn-ribbon protein